MKTLKSDYELVSQFIEGQESGMELLISRHRDRVYTYIYLIVKEQTLAEDLFQETFIKVIQSLKAGKYRENGKFRSWVLRIAHNLIIDHYRKEKQLKTLSRDEYDADILNSKKHASGTIEEELIHDQVICGVRSLIDELPKDQKEVVLLRHYAGLSFREIAEQTNVSINTALGRMRYALINMRKLMKEKNMSLTIN